ncbi:alpha/beta fold hydrolase [Pontixanthobacter sp.]|uniref:alpha/beta fold hydrolase n=1 Tax=Pontixanthobacter sp. TaxID=2792078 RepID=UPI003C7E2C9B
MKTLGKILLGAAALLIIALLFFRTPDTDPAEMRAKYAGEPSQFVALPNGVTVHLRDEGPANGNANGGAGAPVMILLHGSNADLLTWDPWVERLSDEYRIIRFDQPGHGLTGGAPDGTYEIESYVETVDQLADAMGLEKFILGGNSMGGGHSLAYAAAHPKRVQGLILIDASGAPPSARTGEDKSRGNIGFTIAQTPVLNQLMKHISPRSIIEQSLRQSVTNQDIVTDAAIDRYWEMLRYPGNRAATIVRFSQTRTPFSKQQLAKLTMPALVIWGGKDTVIPLSAGQWLDQNLPNSKLVVLENIGHLPMEEAPDASANAVKAWMRQSGLAGSSAQTLPPPPVDERVTGT